MNEQWIRSRTAVDFFIFPAVNGAKTIQNGYLAGWIGNESQCGSQLKRVSEQELEDALGAKIDLAIFETLRRSSKNPRYRDLAKEIQQTLTYVETTG